MRRVKMNRIIEYIQHLGFDYDTYDVEENFDGILCQYGIYEVFDEEERAQLKAELYQLAEQYEFREMIRIGERQCRDTGLL